MKGRAFCYYGGLYMHKFTKALAAIGLAAVMSQSAIAENLKLGFLVKQPEEPWFQTEWKFADKAGKDLGFDVIKIAVPDGEKTLNAIDSLAASGAKGFVICTPDPKLGSAIAAKARGYGMKVIAVDDQFVNAKGKPMDTVPLVMMAATKIGERQGQELYKEMQKRGWDVKETAVMAITADELDTARRRTSGSMAALKAAGFPEKQIYKVPTKSNDIPGAFDAANSMQIVRGLAYIISDGKAVGIEDERFFTLGYANWLGLPAPIWLTVACLILFGFLLNRTTFGRNTLAIGGNEEAARLAGVPVVRTKIIIFVLSGLVSAAAGIILASRMTSGQPMTSIGYELIVISACVLGGVSLKGGIGKISYVVAGILILGTVENAMKSLWRGINTIRMIRVRNCYLAHRL